MATDNDLAALLPDPPPPRPARREAAIAEALRRFDGGKPAPPAPVGIRPPRAPEWWRRPQLAALASMALVVMIGLPVWWVQRDRLTEVVPQPPVAQISPGTAPGVEPSAPGQPEVPGVAPAEPGAVPAAPTADEAATEVGRIAPPDDAPRPAAIPAPAQQRADAIGYRAPPPPPPPPPPAPAAARTAASGAAAEEGGSDSEDANIVVTGSRVARPSYNSNSPAVSVSQEVLAGGNWSACTILDEEHSLRDCPTRRASGRAATQLADGLTLAWQGEMDRAIDAFTGAIRTSPDFSLAYLNRGLAYQSKGDLRRALADLNRAVATDRTNASAYHYRSELYRARGDTARAEADARRAEELTD